MPKKSKKPTWIEADLERWNAYQREWRHRNRDRVRQYEKNRRARAALLSVQKERELANG